MPRRRVPEYLLGTLAHVDPGSHVGRPMKPRPEQQRNSPGAFQGLEVVWLCVKCESSC